MIKLQKEINGTVDSAQSYTMTLLVDSALGDGSQVVGGVRGGKEVRLVNCLFLLTLATHFLLAFVPFEICSQHIASSELDSVPALCFSFFADTFAR